MMKPAILFLGTQMAVGGAQRMLLLQARWFHQQGYRVFAGFFYDKEGLYDRWKSEQEYPIICLDGWVFGASPITNSLRLLRALWRLWQILKNNDISVIETFTPHSDLWGLPVAWLAKVPVRIGCFQGIIHRMSQRQTWVHARLINSPVATGLVCVSDQMKEFALEKGIHPNKVTTIPNAMDIPDLDTEAVLRGQRDALRYELGVPVEGVLVITSGRLDREKGHTYLIQAIPKVLERHPGTVFVLCGDGYLRADLEKQAVDLNIGDRVQFLGIRHDILALLRAADIFVMPSLAEGLSLAMLEAMVARLPMVLTKVQGSIQVITPGKNGLLVPVGDSNALAQVLCLLLDQPEIWNDLGEAARQTVIDSYAIDQIALQYESLFFVDRGDDIG
jgi:glycosyltransferase involved in cell wall biosynthesis